MYPESSTSEALTARMSKLSLATSREGSGEISSSWLTSALIRSTAFVDLDELEINATLTLYTFCRSREESIPSIARYLATVLRAILYPA